MSNNLRKHFVLLLLMVFAFIRVRKFCNSDIYSCGGNIRKRAFEKALESPEVLEQNIFTRSDKFFNNIRTQAQQGSMKYLPSPHSELLLGMTIGLDNLSQVPRFKDALTESGTIHVVVVSGYNISLVFGLVTAFLGSQYRLKNLLIAQFATFIYSLLSGFDPPVIRSWIMGSIAAWGKYYGRGIEADRLLFFSGSVMVLLNPEFLFSLSFQLSFLATLSLVMFTNPVELILKKKLNLKGVLIEDLTATLAAQVLVWPLISSKFGRVSLISPLVNMLILWTVPLATVIGGLFMGLYLVLSSAGFELLFKMISLIVYVPLDIFTKVVNFGGGLSFASYNFEMSTNDLILYYGLAFIIYRCFMHKMSKGKYVEVSKANET